MQEFTELPVRVTAALGLIFSAGCHAAAHRYVSAGWNNWVASSGPYLLFGLMLSGGSAAAKLFLEWQVRGRCLRQSPPA